MSDTIPVPASIAAAAHVDKDKYEEMYAASVENPDAFWAQEGKRIDWIKPFKTIRNVDYTYGDVSIKWFEDGTLNAAANCLDRHLEERGDQTAILFEPDEPDAEAQHITYREVYGHVCRIRQRPQEDGRGEGRPRRHLPADDPAGGLRDARLRAHRGHPLGGVRRLLARQPRQPHQRQRRQGARHRRRCPPRRAHHQPQGQRRHGAQALRCQREVPRGEAHRRRCRLERGPRCLAGGDGGRRLRRMPARRDERRGSAFHPLHLRLHRKAEGRRPHHRRLHGLRRHDPPAHVRLQARRGLLVHRRRRLGHRAHLHRLRPARERSHLADVRGGADLPGRRAASGPSSPSTRSTPSTPRRPPSAL